MALQIAPPIVAERRILISLYLFMAGVILFHLLPSIWHSGEYLNWLLGGSLLVLITGLRAAIYARHSAGHDRGLFILVAFTVGFALASPQFAQHDQPRIKHGVTADIQGILIKIDGNADVRSRLWIKYCAKRHFASRRHCFEGKRNDSSVQEFGNSVCFDERDVALSML